MNKKTQMIIGVIAVAGISYWLLTKNKKDKVFANAVGKRTGKGRKDCPKGQVKCPNNSKGCYDPKVNYIKNPCVGSGNVDNSAGYMSTGYGGFGSISPSAYGGAPIPTCPDCSKSGKCVERTNYGAYSNGVVVNCVNSNTSGTSGY